MADLLRRTRVAKFHLAPRGKILDRDGLGIVTTILRSHSRCCLATSPLDLTGDAT